MTAQQQANDALWRLGRLEHLVRDSQLDLYHFLRQDDGVKLKRRVVRISRQWGKTYTACVVAVEAALQIPNCVIEVSSSTAVALKRYLLPNMRRVLRSCPEDMQPAYNGQDHVFTFKNGSVIGLSGVDSMRKVDARRGSAVHLWIVDESGFIPSDELKELVESVIGPSFQTTNGRMILMGTPARTPNHFFTLVSNEAKATGACIERDVDSIPNVSQQEKDEWAKEAGGYESATWLREYKCQDVLDERTVIIPEFADKQVQSDIVVDVEPPDWHRFQFLKKLVSVDIGYSRDPYGLLFGYYDFECAKLVIQREASPRNVTTDVIADTVTKAELELWRIKSPDHPHVRIADIDPEWHYDMRSMHHLAFQPVRKMATLDAMVNMLRIWFKDRRIEIDRSCKELVYQLMTGLWDPSHTGFMRVPDHADRLGHHHDLIAALVYMRLSVPEFTNPFPNVNDTNTASHHVQVVKNLPSNKSHAALAGLGHHYPSYR